MVTDGSDKVAVAAALAMVSNCSDVARMHSAVAATSPA